MHQREALRNEHVVPLPNIAPKLHTMSFTGDGDYLTDGAYEALAGLSELRTLCPHLGVTHAQLRSLAKLPLTSINLSEAYNIDASVLSVLPPTLFTLEIDSHKLIGHVHELSRFPEMTELSAHWEEGRDYWTQRDLDALAELPCCKRSSLKTLMLVVAAPCTLDAVCNVPSLHSLDLTLADADDATLKPLSQLHETCCVHLWLEGGVVTDAGLSYLARLKLHTLVLEQLDDITDAALAQLRTPVLQMLFCGGVKGDTLCQMPCIRYIELEGMRHVSADNLLKLASLPMFEGLTLYAINAQTRSKAFKRQWRQLAADSGSVAQLISLRKRPHEDPNPELSEHEPAG